MGLESVEFILEIEDAFQIEIPDKIASAMETPRDLINWISKNKISLNLFMFDGEIRKKVKDILINQMRLNEEDYDENKHFIKDYGMG